MFMTLSVYSLRVQTDTAPQSQFLPLVTLYFILGISYAFIALIWFIVANNWTVKNNLPPFLVVFAGYIKRVLFWIYDETPIWKSKIAPEPEKDKQKVLPPDTSTVENKETVVKLSTETDDPSKKLLDDPNVKCKCNTCDSY